MAVGLETGLILESSLIGVLQQGSRSTQVAGGQAKPQAPSRICMCPLHPPQLEVTRVRWCPEPESNRHTLAGGRF